MGLLKLKQAGYEILDNLLADVDAFLVDPALRDKDDRGTALCAARILL